MHALEKLVDELILFGQEEEPLEGAFNKAGRIFREREPTCQGPDLSIESDVVILHDGPGGRDIECQDITRRDSGPPRLQEVGNGAGTAKGNEGGVEFEPGETVVQEGEELSLAAEIAGLGKRLPFRRFDHMFFIKRQAQLVLGQLQSNPSNGYGRNHLR